MRSSSKILNRFRWGAPVAGLLLLAGITAVSAEEGDPHRRDRHWQRLHNGITPAAMADAAERARRLPAARSLPRISGEPEGLEAVAPGGSPWQFFGPRPILADGAFVSGRVTSLAVVGQTLYAGGANGGVWKSTNGGGSWSPMSAESTIASLAIGSIALDPANSNVIYAGTGEPNFSSSQPGRGVLKSSDGGLTWSLLGSGDPFPPGTYTNRLIVGPTGTVWVASNQGLHRSTTGGSTWKRIRDVHGFPSGEVWDVARSSNGNLMYAAVKEIGVYRSQDGGSSWTRVTGGLPPSVDFMRRARLAIAPSRAATAYLVIVPDTLDIQAPAPPVDQIYVTTNSGTAWTSMPVNTRAGHTYDGYNLEVAVDPLNPSLPYVAGLIWTTPFVNATLNTWLPVGANLHVDQHAIAFPACTVSPCPYYVGNDGGVYRIDPFPPQQGGPHVVSTANLNSDLELTEVVGGDLGINFVQEPRALAGTQDNGTIVYEPSFPGRSNPLEWSRTLDGDGGLAFLAHQPATSTLAYTEQQQDLGLYRSASRGDANSWARLDSGLMFDGEFYAVYTLDKTAEQHLAYADGPIVRETLGGTWYQSSQNLGSLVTALAFAPGNGAILYAGTVNGQVFRTTSAGSGGESMYQPAATGLPATLRINGLAVDPDDSNAVYAVGSNSSDGAPNVFRTLAGGSWTSLQGNLPVSLPIYSVLTYRSGASRVVVIGTFVGAYFTANEGATWSSLNNGLPNTKVARVAIDRDQTTIAAFTAGRGAFSTNIGGGPPCTYSISPAGASISAAPASGSIAVTTQPGCGWTAVSNAPWLTVTAGASGTGSGTVSWSAGANSGTSPRTGLITVTGSQTFTLTQSGSTPSGVPSAPAGLTATALSISQIRLDWTDTSGNETGFSIERKTGTSAFAQVATVGANATTYTDNNLTSGTTYTYRVRATNSVGLSAPSNEVSATTQGVAGTPAPPTDLFAQQNPGFLEVQLNWTDNSSNETSFRVERRTFTGYSEIAVLGPDTTFFTDFNIGQFATYTYRVRACNASGCSAYSNESSVSF